ncbi:hypothetical protein [Phyllobacterium lublinensis]|uniref:hypothetical protein n=1 Tax=Phyllobacterium lublinensis TaxID=2875708 RepID=UPI001CCE73F7|nr:hypothetical protein [Phyllobacterium sp. 2063]MBZ9653534.1 hypothetical protein [Phyllobacterium sp. 2063]
MTTKKIAVNWAEIEKDYRAGTMGIREMGRWYQLSDTAIRKKAKAEGWVRNAANLRSQAVRTSEVHVEPVIMAGIDATKPENIVGKGRNLIARLLEELDAVTTNNTDLSEMIEAEESDPRRRAAMLKAIDLPNRANVVKSLATAFKTFSEAQAPEGKKAQRQHQAEEAAASGSKYATRSGPRLAINNT